MLMISPPFFLPHQPPKLKEGVREVTQLILAQWTRVTCWWLTSLLFSSVAQLCPTLWPHGLQHARLPCPSPTLGACSNSCPWKLVMPSNHLILCCPLLLLPSVFPSIGSFPMSQFFTSGGQSTGVSASTSVLPMNTQDWFPLGWTGWISLLSKGLSRVFSNTSSSPTPLPTTLPSVLAADSLDVFGWLILPFLTLVSWYVCKRVWQDAYYDCWGQWK